MHLTIKLQRSDDEIARRFGELRSRADLADLLELPDEYLRRILYLRKEPHKYRTFTIKKKRGGQRTISVPPPALAVVQAKLNHVFQLVYRKKRAVHGFVRGRSILSNAASHVGRRWVLNVDVEEFFPSVNFGRVRGMLMAPPYRLPNAPATVIAQICCNKQGLPQGAPSSPMLANMVCGRLDGELTALARRHSATYTRYADDITFSTRKAFFPTELAVSTLGWIGNDVSVGASLRQVVETNGFTLKSEKTRLQLADCHQEVTGLTVNVFPNVNRSMIRDVRAMLHKWKTNGLAAAEQEYHQRFAKPDQGPGSQPSLARVVKGKINFIRMVRGQSDPVYVKLHAKLWELDPTIIGPPPSPLPRSGGSLPGVGSDPGWTRWYQRLRQSVLLLEIESDGRILSGTAFAYRSDHLATAAHNIVGEVRLANTPGMTVVSDIRCHADYSRGVDCAIIRVSHGQVALEVHPLLPEPGDPIAIIGFASVPHRHPSLGIYPGAVESLSGNYQGTTIIQVTVQSAGGLSGSPVINARGQVIGMVVESTFENTGASVPGREFCSVLPIAHLAEVLTGIA